GRSDVVGSSATSTVFTSVLVSRGLHIDDGDESFHTREPIALEVFAEDVIEELLGHSGRFALRVHVLVSPDRVRTARDMRRVGLHDALVSLDRDHHERIVLEARRDIANSALRLLELRDERARVVFSARLDELVAAEDDISKNRARA